MADLTENTTSAHSSKSMSPKQSTAIVFKPRAFADLTVGLVLTPTTMIELKGKVGPNVITTVNIVLVNAVYRMVGGFQG